jgi:hypothetical protein
MEKLVSYYLILIIIILGVIIFSRNKKSTGQDYNIYFRYFSFFLFISLPFLLVIDGSRYRVGFEMLELCFTICISAVIILLLSFIKNIRILNWIYGTIYFFYFFSYLLKMLKPDQNYEEYNLTVLKFVSFFPSLIFSFFTYFLLKKKEKKISLWLLVCSVELFFWIIVETYYLLTCNLCRHAI